MHTAADWDYKSARDSRPAHLGAASKYCEESDIGTFFSHESPCSLAGTEKGVKKVLMNSF